MLRHAITQRGEGNDAVLQPVIAWLAAEEHGGPRGGYVRLAEAGDDRGVTLGDRL